MLELFHVWNVRVRLPKDQPTALEEDPCSLMQHCLAVCTDGIENGPWVDRRGIDTTFIPHLGWWSRTLHPQSLWTRRQSAEVQGTVRVWIDGVSMPPSSHTYTIGGSPSPAQSLTKMTECMTEGGCPSTHRRPVSGVSSMRVLSCFTFLIQFIELIRWFRG